MELWVARKTDRYCTANNIPYNIFCNALEVLWILPPIYIYTEASIRFVNVKSLKILRFYDLCSNGIIELKSEANLFFCLVQYANGLFNISLSILSLSILSLSILSLSILSLSIHSALRAVGSVATFGELYPRHHPRR